MIVVKGADKHKIWYYQYMNKFKTLSLIAVAGAAGALLRWSISVWSLPAGGIIQGWPWATFYCNVAGCLVIGMIIAVSRSKLRIHQAAIMALQVGFIGSFTTFSALSLEVLFMLEQGRMGLLARYLLISFSVGLCVAWLGFVMVNKFLRLSNRDVKA